MSVAEEIIIEISRDTIEATAKTGRTGWGEPDFDPLRLATIQALEELLLEDMMDGGEISAGTEVSAIQRKHIVKASHLKVLGRQLYAVLFSKPKGGKPDIETLLFDKLKEVKPERLRLQLTFDTINPPDAEWINLPWEFLYSEKRSEFLSTDFNLVLSRYLKLDEDREEFKPGEEALRLLVVVSRPALEAPVISKDVLAKIKELETGPAGTLPAPKANLQVRDLKQPDQQALENALRDFNPHVLHFIGHGKYDPKDKTGYLLLVKEATGEGVPFSTDQLLSTFNAAQCYPRLVFLHMCEGGISERDATTRQAFSGFAPRLIHAKIPTVVAMQYPIKNEPARDFSLAFYQVLASGGKVDEAVQEGRRRMDSERRSLVFGTPVLFMHSADGLVLPPPKPGEGAKPAGEIGGQPAAQVSGEGRAPTGGQLPAADASVVEQVIQVGLQAANSLSGATQAIMIARLSKLKTQLIGKSSTEILNLLLDVWNKEKDVSIKEIWFNMMGVVPISES